jgi:PAS domain S-box-containing protein
MGNKTSTTDPASGRGKPLLSQVAEALLQSTIDGVLIVDKKGMIRECNLAAEQMFGYPRGDLLGTRIERLLPERFRNKHSGHRHGFHAHSASRTMGERQDLYALRADGQEFSVDIALIPLELEGEQFVGTQLRDMTWRTEHAKKLKASLAEVQRLKSQIEAENLTLHRELSNQHGYEEIVGHSPALQQVLAQVDKVAPTNATVLITGETGTGKELLARAVHEHSKRRGKLFLPVNCASLPANLVESELFGHEKGAFTGATSERMGRFEQANHGTLFMDEIGDMPLEAQAKLLRVLQSGDFERVGSTKPRQTDVRVVAATNKDLKVEVREGRFRRDLYHRLSTFPLHMPPLRERREDIPLLTSFLITRKARQLGRTIKQIPKGAMERLMAYDWPGNVRELENVLERSIILSPDQVIQSNTIHLTSSQEPSGHAHEAPRPFTIVDETLRGNEYSHILRVCESCGWKIKGPGGAAQKLGLNPGTLYSRMKKLGIKRP